MPCLLASPSAFRSSQTSAEREGEGEREEKGMACHLHYDRTLPSPIPLSRHPFVWQPSGRKREREKVVGLCWNQLLGNGTEGRSRWRLSVGEFRGKAGTNHPSPWLLLEFEAAWHKLGLPPRIDRLAEAKPKCGYCGGRGQLPHQGPRKLIKRSRRGEFLFAPPELLSSPPIIFIKKNPKLSFVNPSPLPLPPPPTCPSLPFPASAPPSHFLPPPSALLFLPQHRCPLLPPPRHRPPSSPAPSLFSFLPGFPPLLPSIPALSLFSFLTGAPERGEERGALGGRRRGGAPGRRVGDGAGKGRGGRGAEEENGEEGQRCWGRERRVGAKGENGKGYAGAGEGRGGRIGGRGRGDECTG